MEQKPVIEKTNVERRNQNEPLFWMDKEGKYHVCRKRREEVKNPDGTLDIRTVAAIVAAIAALASPFITMAVAQEKLRVQEESNKSQWETITETKAIAGKHEVLIPLIQQDVKDIKESQKIMSEKMDRNFEALMKAVKS